MIKLRDYQEDLVSAVDAALGLGIRRQLCVLPTGAGKTICAAVLPNRLRPFRVLFLAHRDELLDQAVKSFKLFYPDLKIQKEIGDIQADNDSHIVMGSVATLGRSGAKRLERIFGNDPTNILVITDEAHHATSTTYRNIYKFFGLLNNTTSKNTHVGITATPFRGDNSTLSDIFDDITYMKKLGDMILEGWVCDVKSFHIQTDTDISNVKSSGGDFNIRELSEAVNTPERNNLIVDAYLYRANGTKALAFCVDVQHAKSLKEYFCIRNIPAACITGETDKTERKNIIEQFRAGRIQVLTNCSVLTEGFDVPDTETIIMARPTKSPVFFSQAVGRGLRVHEKKKYAILLDMYDRVNNPPVHMDRLLNNPVNNCTYAEWKKTKELVEDKYPYLAPDEVVKALEARSIEDIVSCLSSMNILEVLIRIYNQGVDSFISSKSKLSWSKLADGSYFIQSSGIGKIAIRSNALGSWELWRKEPRKAWDKLFTGEPTECFKRGDQIIEDNEKTQLYLRSAPWKYKPATKGQLTFIKKLAGQNPGISIDSRGKAAHLINYLLEDKRK